MIQKIKILNLVKTAEYIQKELDFVKGLKRKLLADSDWTQLVDCGLSRSEKLSWRKWRSKVRSVNVTADNISQSNEILQELKNNTPNK